MILAPEAPVERRWDQWSLSDIPEAARTGARGPCRALLKPLGVAPEGTFRGHM
jgi:hypothetical protein